MNANMHFTNATGAAKLALPSLGHQPPLSDPDDLDLGFDILVRRYATHRIADAVAAGAANPAFSALIAPPEVTFAAYLNDGSVVLCCPDGLPDTLAGLAEVLTPTHRAQPAPPLTALPAAQLLARLDALDRKLDHMQRNHATGDEIVDQLDEIRATLQDGFDRDNDQRNAAAAVDLQNGDMPDIIARLDGIAEQIGTFAAPLIGPMDIEQALSESEDRLIAAIRHRNAGTEVTAMVHQIDERVQGIARVLADLPDVDALLRRLEDRFDAAAERPAPQADLVAQRQGTAQFLGSMGIVLRRLEAAIDGMTPSAAPNIEQRLANLEDQLQGLPDRLQSAIEPRPDLAEWAGQLTDMVQDINRGLQPQPQIAEALQQLAGQISSLAQRPDPVLDLSRQRQSFAQFGTAFAHALARMEAVSQTLEAPPQSATQVLADVQEAVMTQKTIAANMQEVLSQAVMGLLVAQSPASELPAGQGTQAAAPLQGAHPPVPQSRRLHLAEVMAQDVKARAENVQPLIPYKFG